MSNVNRTAKEEKALFKAIVPKENTKLYSNLISIGISIFFALPFFFMWQNMFIFMNISYLINLPLIAIIFCLTSLRRWIYYDLLKKQNDCYNDINIKKVFLKVFPIELGIMVGFLFGIIL